MSSASAQARWALLSGNFVIGCGVMVVAGTLNDLARSLAVSVALAGQLIAIGAVVMGIGAPLLAGWVAGFDRRRLLALSLAWYAGGHALSALMPDYAALEAQADVGAGVVQPDETDDLRPNKEMPSVHPAKNDTEGTITSHQKENQ